jgi:hypothetical protein
MEQTAWVHKLGAEKYGPWNWRETGVCASTYVNAILRHLNAWRDGESLDPESGITHLAHIACSANILMDAEVCGKLQDDRNKRPTNDETEGGSPKVGGFELDEELMNDILKWIRGEDEEPPTKHVEDNKPYEDFWGPLDEDTVPEYRVLKEGEKLQDGDEVYVGEDHWLPVYVSDWMTPAIVNGGTYRRKITNCDLKDEPEIETPTCSRESTMQVTIEGDVYRLLDNDEVIQAGDEYFVSHDRSWHKTSISGDWGIRPVDVDNLFRRKITNCDLKDKVADCDLKEESPIDDECKCGRRKVYHWLYGYICEDCDLKSHDSYYP